MDDERAVAAGLDEMERELIAARAALARAEKALDAIRRKLRAQPRPPSGRASMDSTMAAGVDSLMGGAME